MSFLQLPLNRKKFCQKKMDVNYWLWKFCIWCLQQIHDIHTLKFDLDQISPNSKNGAKEKKSKHIFWPRKFKNVIISRRMFSKRRQKLSNSVNQSHYREVARWEIFMEQELRFGLDLGRLALLKKKDLGWLWATFKSCFFTFGGSNKFRIILKTL